MKVLTESNGKLSSMRLLMAGALAVTFGVWAFVSIRTSVLASLPESLVTLNGLLIGGKTVQRFGEK